MHFKLPNSCCKLVVGLLEDTFSSLVLASNCSAIWKCFNFYYQLWGCVAASPIEHLPTLSIIYYLGTPYLAIYITQLGTFLLPSTCQNLPVGTKFKSMSNLSVFPQICKIKIFSPFYQ